MVTGAPSRPCRCRSGRKRVDDVRRDVVRRGVEPRRERRDLLSEGGEKDAKVLAQGETSPEIATAPNCFALSLSLARSLVKERKHEHEKKRATLVRPLSFSLSTAPFLFLSRPGEKARREACRKGRGLIFRACWFVAETKTALFSSASSLSTSNSPAVAAAALPSSACSVGSKAPLLLLVFLFFSFRSRFRSERVSKIVRERKKECPRATERARRRAETQSLFSSVLPVSSSSFACKGGILFSLFDSAAIILPLSAEKDSPTTATAATRRFRGLEVIRSAAEEGRSAAAAAAAATAGRRVCRAIFRRGARVGLVRS